MKSAPKKTDVLRSLALAAAAIGLATGCASTTTTSTASAHPTEHCPLYASSDAGAQSTGHHGVGWTLRPVSDRP